MSAARQARAAAWSTKVCYRHPCAVCGETHLCAVVRRRDGKRDLRVCRHCYEGGKWRHLP